jgi:hypothetical protein
MGDKDKWDKIANLVGTRDKMQVISHNQAFERRSNLEQYKSGNSSHKIIMAVNLHKKAKTCYESKVRVK